MTKGSSESLSVDEYVATLRNSALPTLLVEGRSDMSMFQSIEDECFSGEVDILPVGGRTSLFEIYSRRVEYRDSNVAFLADADMFAFGSPPREYTDVIFTHGYSIENDILSGGEALKVITRKHKSQWEKILRALCHWFASIVHRCLEGEFVTYNFHPSKIVDFHSGEIHPAYRSVLISGYLLRSEAAGIALSPIRYLRGHTLIDGIGHFLAETKFRPKCSKEFLLHLDVLSWEDNVAISRIVSEVRRACL